MVQKRVVIKQFQLLPSLSREVRIQKPSMSLWNCTSTEGISTSNIEEANDWLALNEPSLVAKTSFNGSSTFYHHESKGNLIPFFYQAVYREFIQLCEQRNKRFRSNLLKEELDALEALKTTDDIIIRQADKGGRLVVLDSKLHRKSP